MKNDVDLGRVDASGTSAAAGPVVAVEVELTDGSSEQILHAAVFRVRCALDADASQVESNGPLSGTVHLTCGAQAQVMLGQAAPNAAHTTDTHLLVLSFPRRGALSAKDEARAVDALRRIPFTRAELRTVAAEMPLTCGLRERFPDRPLAEAVVLIMAHFLTDLTGMLAGAMALGATPRTLVIVDKGYPYKARERVAAHLADLGITSFHSSRISEALAFQGRRAAELKLKPIIIDDGGYALPALIDHLPEQLASCAGLVEQTMSGIFKLEPYEERLTLPIFSVAQSRIKGTIESYWIADAAVRRILDLMPPHKIEGQPALVIGYGQVGSEIARILTGLRMRVAVYDRELIRMIVAHETGYVTHDDLTTLIREHRPILIVGGTGRQALDQEQLDVLPRECFLASVTSRNGEFPLPQLRDSAVHVRDEGLIGTCYELPHGAKVTVLAHGYPVNFHYAESIRNRHSDLTLASLLVGACTLARDSHGFQAGHNVERTDQVLQDSHLLQDYYALYGPSSSRTAPALPLPARRAER